MGKHDSNNIIGSVTNFFQGNLDDFYFWDRTITQEEALFLYDRFHISDDIIEEETYTICNGESAFVEVPFEYDNITWSDGQTGNTAVFTSAGVYTMEGFYNCHVVCDTVTIEIDEPFIDIGEDVITCDEVAVLLVANDVVNWSTGEIASQIIVSESGDYFAYIGDNCIVYDTVNVIIEINQSIDLDDEYYICGDDQIVLEILGDYDEIQWSNGITESYNVITEPGMYAVTGTQINCPQDIHEFEVIDLAFPIDIGPDTSACADDVLLTANEIVNWSTGEIASQITISESGIYTAFYGVDCIVHDTVEVTTIADEEIALEDSYTLCEGESLILTISGAYDNITWSNGAVGNINVLVEAGEYMVIGTQGICEVDTHNFEVIELNSNLISEEEIISCNNEVTLTANDIVTWSTGEVSNEIVVTEAGQYSAIFEDECTVFDTIDVMFLEDEELALEDSYTLCEGDSLTLTVSGAYDNITWSNGAVGNINVLIEAGEYMVIGTQGICEIDTHTFEIIEWNSNLIAEEEIISCSIEVTLTAIGIVTWSTGEVSNEIVVTETDQYSAIFEDDCMVLDTINVTFLEDEEIALDDIYTLCEGDSLTLTISGLYDNITWSNGAAGNINIVTEAGEYMVIGTQGICEIDTHLFEVIEFSSDLIVEEEVVSCIKEVTLTANEVVTWSTGEISNEIIVTETGQYTASFEDFCTILDTIDVTIIDDEEIVLDEIYTLCEGDSLTLTISGQFDNITWSNGAVGNINVVTEAGEYTVVGNQSICKPDTHIFNVIYLSDEIEVNLGEDLLLCDSVVILENLDFSHTLNWSTGEIAPQISVSQSGEYIATIEEECGSGSDTINVIFLEDLTIDLESTYNICEGEKINIAVNTPYDAFLWSDGSTESSTFIETPGVYQFIGIQNICGADTAFFEVISLDTLETLIVSDTIICEEETIRIGVSSDSNNVQWSNGETTDSILVTEAGMYSISVSNECDNDVYTINIRQVESETITTSSSVICDGETATIVGPESADTYLWSTGETTNLISVQESGSYSLEYSIDGCHFITEEVDISIVTCNDCKIYVPNVFSPNKDETNDFFEIKANRLACLEGLMITIFDNWGNLIYHNRASIPWDGTFKGKDVQPSVLVYKLEGTVESEDFIELGSFTLLK